MSRICLSSAAASSRPLSNPDFRHGCPHNCPPHPPQRRPRPRSRSPPNRPPQYTIHRPWPQSRGGKVELRQGARPAPPPRRRGDQRLPVEAGDDRPVGALGAEPCREDAYGGSHQRRNTGAAGGLDGRGGFPGVCPRAARHLPGLHDILPQV